MRLADFKFKPILHSTDAKHQTNNKSSHFDHRGSDSQATGEAGSNYFSHDMRGDKSRLDGRSKGEKSWVQPDMSQSLKKPPMQNHPNPAILNLKQAPIVYKPILASASQSMHLSAALKGQTGNRFNSPMRPIGLQQWNPANNSTSGHNLLPNAGNTSAASSFPGHQPTPDLHSNQFSALDRNLANTPAKVLAEKKQDLLSYLSPLSQKGLAEGSEKQAKPISGSTEMSAEQREEYQQLLNLKDDLLSKISVRKNEKENIARINHMLLKKIDLISQNFHQRPRTM